MPGKEWHSKPVTADLTWNEKWCNTGCNTRGLGWFHSICGIPWIAVLGNRVVAVLLTKSWLSWTLTVIVIGDNRSSRSSSSVWVFLYWQQSKVGNALCTYISFCHSPDKSTRDCALLFIANTTLAWQVPYSCWHDRPERRVLFMGFFKVEMHHTCSGLT